MACIYKRPHRAKGRGKPKLPETFFVKLKEMNFQKCNTCFLPSARPSRRGRLALPRPLLRRVSQLTENLPRAQATPEVYFCFMYTLFPSFSSRSLRCRRWDKQFELEIVSKWATVANFKALNHVIANQSSRQPPQTIESNLGGLPTVCQAILQRY